MEVIGREMAEPPTVVKNQVSFRVKWFIFILLGGLSSGRSVYCDRVVFRGGCKRIVVVLVFVLDFCRRESERGWVVAKNGVKSVPSSWRIAGCACAAAGNPIRCCVRVLLAPDCCVEITGTLGTTQGPSFPTMFLLVVILFFVVATRAKALKRCAPYSSFSI